MVIHKTIFSWKEFLSIFPKIHVSHHQKYQYTVVYFLSTLCYMYCTCTSIACQNFPYKKQKPTHFTTSPAHLLVKPVPNNLIKSSESSRANEQYISGVNGYGFTSHLPRVPLWYHDRSTLQYLEESLLDALSSHVPHVMMWCWYAGNLVHFIKKNYT